MSLSGLQGVSHKMRVIAAHVLTRWRMRCALNADAETMDSALEKTKTFIEALKHEPHEKLTYESFLTQV